MTLFLFSSRPEVSKVQKKSLYLRYIFKLNLKVVLRINYMGSEAELLVAKIVEGIQEKKGKNIVTVDLRNLPSGICQFFVICEGNSPSQVSAIYESVWECVHRDIGEKPYVVDGERNAEWIAMDYGTVIVHIFLPERRAYYNLEYLWADAKMTRVPDLD